MYNRNEFNSIGESAREQGVDPGLIYGGGTGRWQNWIDTRTGKQSVQRHELRTVARWCPKKDHIYTLTDGARRTVVCDKCGHERTFILGMEKLVDGKIVAISPKT